jgi:hypothetical protein
LTGFTRSSFDTADVFASALRGGMHISAAVHLARNAARSATGRPDGQEASRSGWAWADSAASTSWIEMMPSMVFSTLSTATAVFGSRG